MMTHLPLQVNGEEPVAADESNEAEMETGNEDTTGSAGKKHMTPEMEKACRKGFDMFDLDSSGKISAAEFGTVMRSLGQNPTDEEIDSLLKVK